MMGGGGGGGGGLLGMLGGAAEGVVALKSSEKAWHRQKKILQNAVSWRVDDMRRAGLNPILAINPGAGSSAGSVNMGITPAIGSRLAEGMKAGASSSLQKVQEERERANADALRSQKQLYDAQADRESVSALNMKLGLRKALVDSLVHGGPEGYNIGRARAWRDAVGPVSGAVLAPMMGAHGAKQLSDDVNEMFKRARMLGNYYLGGTEVNRPDSTER